MNIFDFEIFLIWIVASAVSLTLFIYLGQLGFLKKQAPQRTPLKRQVSNTKELNAGIERRRIESKPRIICSLPIHQQIRHEAPFF